MAKIINIDDLNEQNTIDTKSVDKNQNTEVQIHPDLAGINFRSRADQTPSALYAKQELVINTAVECDNTDNEKIGIMSKIEINDEPPVSPFLTQPKTNDAGEQFLKTYNIIEVPVCNDLVNLSCEMIHEANLEPSVVVLNSDIQAHVFSVSNFNAYCTDKTVPGPSDIRNIVPFKIRNNYPFVSGRIGELSVPFSCDTGAAITAISALI